MARLYYPNDVADVMIVVDVLKNHGIEVWEQYAVERYEVKTDAGIAPGERLIPLGSFKTYTQLDHWLSWSYGN